MNYECLKQNIKMGRCKQNDGSHFMWIVGKNSEGYLGGKVSIIH